MRNRETPAGFKPKERPIRRSGGPNGSVKTAKKTSNAKPWSGQGWEAAIKFADLVQNGEPWSGKCMRNRETSAGFKSNQPKPCDVAF